MTTNSGVRYFTDSSVPKAITTTPTLFPFPAAYSVFAGDCANNAAAHRRSRPTLSRSSPASSTTRSTVRVPALNLVTQINGVDKPGMYVRIKSTTAGCTPKTYLGADLERQLPPR